MHSNTDKVRGVNPGESGCLVLSKKPFEILQKTSWLSMHYNIYKEIVKLVTFKISYLKKQNW